MSWLRYLLIFSLGANATAHASDAVVGGTRPVSPMRVLKPLPSLSLTKRRAWPVVPNSVSVLKIDNDAGEITVSRCTLENSQIDLEEPQETDCVELGHVRPYDLQVFQSKDLSCRTLTAEHLKIIGLLAFSAASLGAAIGIVVGGFTEQFWRYGVGISAGAALVGMLASYYFGIKFCEHGLSVLIERLYDEVQSKVPVDRTRLIFADDRTWTAIDAVLGNK